MNTQTIRIGFAAFATLAVAVAGHGSPEFSIDTLAEWNAATAPGGTITAVQTWDDGAFELLYPGEDDQFIVPTLTVGGDDFDAWLDLQAPPEAVDPIFAIHYTYGVDPDLTGKVIKIKLRKLRPVEGQGDYSVTIWDRNLKRATRAWPIPRGSAFPPDERIVIDVSVGVLTPEDGFDITKTTRITVDYHKVSSTSLFSIQVIPTPATLALLTVAAVVSRGRRAPRPIDSR